MSRKDYVKIAKIINNLDFYHHLDDISARELRESLTKEFSIILKYDNPSCDANKFDRACGVN